MQLGQRIFMQSNLEIEGTWFLSFGEVFTVCNLVVSVELSVTLISG